MVELKPCPFCGELMDQTGFELTDGTKWAAVVCGCLEVRTGYDTSDDAAWRQKAAGLWNTRPIEDALRAERDDLKARLEKAERVEWFDEDFLEVPGFYWWDRGDGEMYLVEIVNDQAGDFYLYSAGEEARFDIVDILKDFPNSLWSGPIRTPDFAQRDDDTALDGGEGEG